MRRNCEIAFMALLIFISAISCKVQQKNQINTSNLYPWCIVAFDSVDRSPKERISMLKELGFDKYAYDWRDSDLDDMAEELLEAEEKGIEVISVWLWLNAKRDTLGRLSPSNEKIFEILKGINLKTTLWVSFSDNFFRGYSQNESIDIAKNMIEFIHIKADKIGCDISMYNHHGWFGNPFNQVEIIKQLSQFNLSMVFNFHHAHDYMDQFPEIVQTISPYLYSVNLNGMEKEGSQILPIGEGKYEKEMIRLLMAEGFNGPWGILGHEEDEDVEEVLRRNLDGLKSLGLSTSFTE